MAATPTSVRQFLCKHTGKLYWRSDTVDGLDELPDDIDDGEKYAQIPSQRELGIKPAAMSL